MDSSDWSDYIATAQEHVDEGASVADVAGDLHDAADAAGLDDAVADSIVTDLDTAAHEADLGAGSESWAEWHAGIADDNAQSAQDYADYAERLAASGDTELAADALETAQMYADNATDAYETAGDYTTEAEAYLAEAGDHADSAVATDASLGDPGSFESYDTGSYDTGTDTSSYDAGADTSGYDTSSYDSGSSEV